jgi:hypothetical protein
MPDIRRDLKQAIMTGAETTILAVAVLTGVFVGVFGAEVSSPPGNAIFWCPWFYQSHCAVRTVRTSNVPISNFPINNSPVSPI